MFEEFKAFAARGNVIDMAVGVVIGTAFGRIVSSLVSDILMPPLGLLLGNADFTDLFLNLSGPSVPSLIEAKRVGAVTVNYGVFVNQCLEFLIVAFAVFALLKMIGKETQPAVK